MDQRSSFSGCGSLVPAEVGSSDGSRVYAEAQVSDGRLVRDPRTFDMPVAEIERALNRPEPERRDLINQHLRHPEQLLRRAHILTQTDARHLLANATFQWATGTMCSPMRLNSEPAGP